ncbi:low molecular weight phosphotyrosine protein phosphatase [Brachybacterium sp. p3-SID1565]|uniref:low molecular weight protein-tyrosine-phosphatase n=1 Tax=Brachybacterium sp. p3-SID1565 TaxID=2916046 RepID=UPI0021A6B527|nr:low molecular weight protein-tyrosine-phosphatase [Brachybacterium sp. p3-SID1565]MCT1384240.1 low molecular weight phosphotyrosine protein phosphatase [Brachybacterium sp. p3-SID1565]
MPTLRVLTVCTGNICRSPAAAVMLREAVRAEGLSEQVEVESAGTSWDAEGLPMDERTMFALERAGYRQPFEHTARTVHLSELTTWDLVLVMTSQHLQSLRRMMEQIPEGQASPEVLLWRQFDPETSIDARNEDLDVPDPWYDEQEAFDETVLGMQRAVPSIMAHVRRLLREERDRPR